MVKLLIENIGRKTLHIGLGNFLKYISIIGNCFLGMTPRKSNKSKYQEVTLHQTKKLCLAEK